MSHYVEEAQRIAREATQKAWDAAIDAAVKAVHANVDNRNITAAQACGLLDDIRALKGRK